MGTTWSVRCLIARDDVYHRDAVAIEAGIDALLAQIVAQMSNWLDDSDIGRFNGAQAEVG